MSKTRTVKCKLCGFEGAVETISSTQVSLFKAEPFELETGEVHCPKCEDDYYSSDDSNAEEKYKIAECQSFTNMLDDMQNLGFQLATIERAYGIPYRTLSRWKTQGKFTKADLTLVRLSYEYPFLIKHAANGYKAENKLKYVHEFLQERYQRKNIDLSHEIDDLGNLRITATATLSNSAPLTISPSENQYHAILIDKHTAPQYIAYTESITE